MNISLIGVPFDLDQAHAGKGLAPEKLLELGLREKLTALGADVETHMLDAALPTGTVEDRIGALLGKLHTAVATARAGGRMPLVLGGDCLTALGTLAGLGEAEHTGIAWIDAHGDFNTPESTLSGYLGGMPLACAVGRGLPNLRVAAQLQPIAERNVVLIGVRDLDEPEMALLQASEVTLMSAMDLTQRAGDIDGALGLLRKAGQVYMHVDIDVLNNDEAPGVDYPAPGGLTAETLHSLIDPIATLPNLAAVALTAVNPEKDIHNRTALAAINVIEHITKGLRTKDT